MAELDRLLSRSLTDFVITDGEANRALQVLEEVRPPDFKKVLSQMESSGTLKKFFDEAPDSSRDGMLNLMASHGMLKREVGKPVDGKFDPPSHPETFVWDRRLPEPVLQAIRGNTHEAWNNYETRFEAYLDRYGSAVQQSATPAELRRLGPPATPASAPGRLITNLDAVEALNEKIHQFRKETPAGTATFKASAEVKIAGEKTTFEVAANRFGTRAQSEPSLEWKSGHLSLEQTASGVTELGGELRGKKVTLRSNGSAEFEFAPSGSPFSLRTDVDPAKGTMAAGVCVGVDEWQSELKVCADVEGKGLTPSGTTLGFSNRDSYFDQPAELVAGKAWASLSEPRRDQLEYRCWTEAEWNAALANRGT